MIGWSGRLKDFHSFRHTFISFARICKADPEIRRALVGHQPGDVDAMYGITGGYPLGPLADAIARIEFPGLKLPSPWEPRATKRRPEASASSA